MTDEEIQMEISKTVKAVSNIPGWLWPREVGALFRQIRLSKLHAEIGTFCGKSLYVAAAAMNGGKIIAIDPLSTNQFSVQSELVPDAEWNREVLNSTIHAIHRNFDTKVEWWEMTSISAIRKAQQNEFTFDSCFIDGSHNRAECEADIVGWLSLVNPGGRILGHDYFPNNMGVITAVNTVFKENFSLLPETRIWVHYK
ncbi:class I SAM-dependent methyltransferase [Gimesia chilikensis]|uniref:Class I SAM-dependent methyltransferase n=1 Tax=Gimesia chilikensis TaxID=2605989 RepID=A0A517PWC0_9PLAN|nr:class I SAM-dependent methyltransferase [Gimesia chilikensis]QDT23667.1 hypothetical protein HG66A1_54890 [Gimesia chilikensis]